MRKSTGSGEAGGGVKQGQSYGDTEGHMHARSISHTTLLIPFMRALFLGYVSVFMDLPPPPLDFQGPSKVLFILHVPQQCLAT